MAARLRPLGLVRPISMACAAGIRAGLVRSGYARAGAVPIASCDAAHAADACQPALAFPQPAQPGAEHDQGRESRDIDPGRDRRASIAGVGSADRLRTLRAVEFVLS